MQRVIVVPHDPAWADAFARESKAVAVALGELHLAVHHIGSTAIPGRHAKPIIDMLAVVSSIAEVDGRCAQLQALGDVGLDEFGIRGRRYFREAHAAGNRTHQIHAFETGSPQIERHLAFRDFMRAHGEYAHQYAALKRRLAELHCDDIEAYMDGKDPFIKQMDAKPRPGEQELGSAEICTASERAYIGSIRVGRTRSFSRHKSRLDRAARLLQSAIRLPWCQMSWDISVFAAAVPPPPFCQMPSDWRGETLGATQEVRDKISRCLPETDWTDPTWASYHGPGFTYEFNISGEGSTDGFMIHVRGGGDAVGPLLELGKRWGWFLLDCSSAE
jgi:GrpB-like predicted nucleotidyltransferase (UPF0157 family)